MYFPGSICPGIFSFYLCLSCPFVFSEHADPIRLENAYSSVSFLYMVQVRLGFTYYGTGEEKKGNQVRECHEAIYDICQCPDFFELEECRGGNDGDVYYAIWLDSLSTKEIYEAAFTVIVPSQDGGEGKQGQTDGYQIVTKRRECLSKGSVGKGCAV